MPHFTNKQPYIRWLTPRQYYAAEEFYRCWYYGGVKSMHGISKYDPNGGGGKPAERLQQLP
jgi:hypothetical protein